MVLLVVLEIEKKTLLLGIVYHIPGPLGIFIDDFMLLTNELPTQDFVCWQGNIDLDQRLLRMLPKLNL